MSSTRKSATAIPLVEEKLIIDKQAIETGRVRIRTVVDEQLARVSQDLERDDVSIERVPINREITAMPQMRQEGDVLIIPLVEEVVVVEKRLVLREELRVQRNRKQERVEEAVRVRSMRAEVERVPTPSKGAVSKTEGAATTPRIRRRETLKETAAGDQVGIQRSRSRSPR